MKKRNPYFDNPILEKNGGLHDSLKYSSAMKMIDECSQKFTAPRVYHIVVHDNKVGVIAGAWTEFVKGLKKLGIDLEWRSALEFDDEQGNHPGTHRHYFLAVESFVRRTNTYICPYADTGMWLAIQEKYHVRFSICPPQNPMHKGEMFARINKTNLNKIEDVKIWISYLYKNRSKRKVRGIYSKSRKPRSNVTSEAVEQEMPSVSDSELPEAESVSSVPVKSQSVTTYPEKKESTFEAMKEKFQTQKEDRLYGHYLQLTTDDEDEFDPPIISNSKAYLDHCTFGVPIDYKKGVR